MRKLFLIYIFIFITINSFGEEPIDPELNCCYENLKTNQEVLHVLDSLKIKQHNFVDILDSYLNNSNKLDTTIIECQIVNDNKCNSCDFLGALIGAIISGLIALGIYKLGEKTANKRLKEEKHELGETIQILLDNSTDFISKQIPEYESYIKKVEDDPSRAQTLRRFPYHNIKRLRSFDPVITYRVFKFLKFDKSLYNQFLNHVDYLDEIMDSIESDYHETNSEYVNKLSNEFLRLSQEILGDTANYIDELKRNGQENTDIYNYLNDLILSYYQIPDDLILPNIKYDYETFIKPMKVELLTNYRYEPFTKAITSKTKRAGDLYISVCQTNKIFKKDIENQLESIKKSHNKLIEINGKMKEIYAS